MLTIEESYARAKRLTDEIDRLGAMVRRGAASWNEVVTAIERAIEFPCTLHHFDPTEVYDELYQALRAADRYDEAIDAKYRAIEVGYRSQPDPEADVAECLLLLGRRHEADALFMELRRRSPDDEYLYNSAGWAYAEVGDHETALRWLRDGLDVAMANGDYDQLAGQLLEMMQRSWAALGQEADDDVARRVRAFANSWTRPSWTPRSYGGGARPPMVACTACEFDPAAMPDAPDAPMRGDVPGPTASVRPSAGSVAAAPRQQLAFAWFDRDEWPLAYERWPDLLADCPSDHQEYCRRLERKIRSIAKQVSGGRSFVAPITVAALDAQASESELDPGEASSRSTLAAEVLHAGGAIPWPPGRNDPCWCGSGTKYKRCCAAA